MQIWLLCLIREALSLKKEGAETQRVEIYLWVAENIRVWYKRASSLLLPRVMIVQRSEYNQTDKTGIKCWLYHTQREMKYSSHFLIIDLLELSRLKLST
jgi:hypothetical protein